MQGECDQGTQHTMEEIWQSHSTNEEYIQLLGRDMLKPSSRGRQSIGARLCGQKGAGAGGEITDHCWEFWWAFSYNGDRALQPLL